MKTKYKDPVIRVVEFQAEKGFAGSDGFGPDNATATAEMVNFVMHFGPAGPRNEQYDFVDEDQNDFWGEE